MELRRAELNEDGQAVDNPHGDYIFHKLEQVDLMTIQEGLELLKRKYQRSIDDHMVMCERNKCFLMKPPQVGTTCAEDLMFLYDQMAKIHHMLFLIQGEGL